MKNEYYLSRHQIIALILRKDTYFLYGVEINLTKLLESKCSSSETFNQENPIIALLYRL